MRSAIMIGLDVAPLAPQARLRCTSSGSIESSHSFVPQATSDSSGVMGFFLLAGRRGTACPAYMVCADLRMGTQARISAGTALVDSVLWRQVCNLPNRG